MTENQFYQILHLYHEYNEAFKQLPTYITESFFDRLYNNP
jgi:hypothetical protein